MHAGGLAILARAPDPDRGWGLAAITRDLDIPGVKPAMLRAVLPFMQVPEAAVTEACERLGGLLPEDLEESLRLSIVGWDLLPLIVQNMIRTSSEWPDDAVVQRLYVQQSTRLARRFDEQVVVRRAQ